MGACRGAASRRFCLSRAEAAPSNAAGGRGRTTFMFEVGATCRSGRRSGRYARPAPGRAHRGMPSCVCASRPVGCADVVASALAGASVSACGPPGSATPQPRLGFPPRNIRSAAGGRGQVSGRKAQAGRSRIKRAGGTPSDGQVGGGDGGLPVELSNGAAPRGVSAATVAPAAGVQPRRQHRSAPDWQARMWHHTPADRVEGAVELAAHARNGQVPQCGQAGHCDLAGAPTQGPLVGGDAHACRRRGRLTRGSDAAPDCPLATAGSGSQPGVPAPPTPGLQPSRPSRRVRRRRPGCGAAPRWWLPVRRVRRTAHPTGRLSGRAGGECRPRRCRRR